MTTARAGERCEAAVSETIGRLRGKEAKDIQFIPGRRSLTPGLQDETGVQGEGRYRLGARTTAFTYSCVYTPSSDATSGVVLREPGAQAAAASAQRNWQPDMTHVSPDACESAIAATLKSKYPRVGRIAFDSDTRRLRPAAQDRTSLEGQGAVQHAVGMNAVPFRYRCEFAQGSAQVLSASTAEGVDGRFEQ